MEQGGTSLALLFSANPIPFGPINVMSDADQCGNHENH